MANQKQQINGYLCNKEAINVGDLYFETFYNDSGKPTYRLCTCSEVGKVWIWSKEFGSDDVTDGCRVADCWKVEYKLSENEQENALKEAMKHISAKRKNLIVLYQKTKTDEDERIVTTQLLEYEKIYSLLLDIDNGTLDYKDY